MAKHALSGKEVGVGGVGSTVCNAELVLQPEFAPNLDRSFNNTPSSDSAARLRQCTVLFDSTLESCENSNASPALP